jgi:hypothetical protein
VVPRTAATLASCCNETRRITSCWRQELKRVKRIYVSEWTTWLIKYTELSPTWEATSYSITQEILNIVTNLINALPGNTSVNTVNVEQLKMCLSGRMLFLVARQ